MLIYSLSNELRAISSWEMGLYPKKQLTSLIKDLGYLRDGIPKDETDQKCLKCLIVTYVFDFLFHYMFTLIIIVQIS